MDTETSSGGVRVARASALKAESPNRPCGATWSAARAGEKALTVREEAVAQLQRNWEPTPVTFAAPACLEWFRALGFDI